MNVIFCQCVTPSVLELDLLINDIGMPKMDGGMLSRQMRERGGQIPVIALTTCVGKYNRHQALSTGFQQHIMKPIETTEIVTVCGRNGGKAV
ncbi:MAG: response regulator [Desmonostoc vinosum HA7617-LM4]|jgi:CheY-like chemotaxis protein|nr:response regulator [Desmonostoc vinosum HA7617-LM4]